MKNSQETRTHRSVYFQQDLLKTVQDLAQQNDRSFSGEVQNLLKKGLADTTQREIR